MTTRIIGEDRLALSLAYVARQLDELTHADRAVATLVFTAATARAPVKTGKLRASGSPDVVENVATVSYSVPYANPIHWGWPSRGIEARPWLMNAASQKEPGVVDIYQEAIQELLDKVKGA